MNPEDNAKRQIEFYKSALSKRGVDTGGIEKREFNFEFSARDKNSKVKVNVYFGKKGLKTVFQGDEKSAFFSLVRNSLIDEPLLNLKTDDLHEPAEYIGTDECGKGDFFGPLVVGAVYVDSETKKILKKIGVKDSKELNESQITYLAPEIKKIIKGNYEIIAMIPQKYNELYGKFANLNKLLDWAHSKIIEKLLDSTNCKYVITDKFKKESLRIHSSSKFSDVAFTQIEKAEKFVGVAAASILAREKLNGWFNDQSNKNFYLPKGASRETESYAAVLYSKIGTKEFSKLAKLHFKTFKRIAEKGTS